MFETQNLCIFIEFHLAEEIAWLNAYNLKIREVTCAEIELQMKERNELQDVLDYVMDETVPIRDGKWVTSKAVSSVPCTGITLCVTLALGALLLAE